MSAVETLTRVIAQTMPKCVNPAGWAPHFHEAMSRFGVNDNKDRVAAFLAQIAVESQELNRLDENLNYSAERLAQVWPRRFAVDPKAKVKQPNALAAKLARNPHGLANHVYANRFGNGPTESGDGYRYRGRGGKMVTFLDNYREMGRLIGVDLVANPDHLLTKAGAAQSAAAYWHSRGLSELADDLPNDDDEADFVSITKRVQGATLGLEMRRAYWARARAALGLV